MTAGIAASAVVTIGVTIAMYSGTIICFGICFGLCFGIASCTGSSPRGLDTSFGNSGKVTLALGLADDEAFAVAVQADGKIVLAGRSFSAGQSDFALARFDTAGAIDTTFGSGGKVSTDFSGASDVAYALAILSDGTLVAGGTATSGASSLFALAKYLANGSLDTSFGTAGKVTLPIGSTQDEIRALGVQPNGYLLAAGFSKASNFDLAVVRLTLAGALDTTFDSDGKKTLSIGTGDDKAHALAIQNDGRIVLAGSSVVSNITQLAVTRLSSDGSLDTTFGSSGSKTISSTSSSQIQDSAFGASILSDGSIVVSGKSDNGSAPQIFIAALTSAGVLNTDFSDDGKLLTNFSTAATALSGYGNAQALQSDGNILVVGNYTSSKGVDFGALSIDRQGSADAGFGSLGGETLDFGSNDEATAVALSGSSAIFIAGKTHNGSNYDFALAKYLQ